MAATVIRAGRSPLTKNPTSSPVASLSVWRASFCLTYSGKSCAAGELAGTRSAPLARGGALDFNSRTESREGSMACFCAARYRTVSPTFFSHCKTYGTGCWSGNSTWQLNTTLSPRMAVMCTASWWLQIPENRAKLKISLCT